MGLFEDLRQQIVLSTVNFTIGRMAIHSGALRPSGEGRTARIDLAMSRMPPCQVEGRARQCKTASLRKEREGIFSQFSRG